MNSALRHAHPICCTSTTEHCLLDHICLADFALQVVEEGARLRQKFYKGMEPIDITMKICNETPLLVATYVSVPNP